MKWYGTMTGKPGENQPTELPRGSVCVCVCPPGNGWFLQVSHSRIVLVEQRGLRAGRIRGAGRWRGLLLHRHWLNLFFLLAGVDTIRGPPHLLVPTNRVLVVLKKGA